MTDMRKNIEFQTLTAKNEKKYNKECLTFYEHMIIIVTCQDRKRTDVSIVCPVLHVLNPGAFLFINLRRLC
jgi:hypothetical protein